MLVTSVAVVQGNAGNIGNTRVPALLCVALHTSYITEESLRMQGDE